MIASYSGRLKGLRLGLRMLPLLFAAPAMAWNAAGHRITALIAWQSMDAETRSAVGQILRQHPDYERWQARARGADLERTAFLEASTWPDDIRRDKRFYTAGLEDPTPTQVGFPDMERRLNWHYTDRPVSPGGVTASSAGVINQKLAELARTVGDRQATVAERAYALPWLIHLVGDAHQPLHTASRYGPDGQSDSGGNQVGIVNPFAPRHASMSLHRYWDDLPGPPWLRDIRLERAVSSLTARHPAPMSPGTPEQWLDESWQLAQQYAYPPGDDAVPTISPLFHADAVAIAGRRVAEAGYRLADLLQRLLYSRSRR